MSFAFWKKGKGSHGNGNTPAKAGDIFLIKRPVSTNNLENKGEDGKNKYISLKDLLPNNNYGIIFHNGLIHIEGYQYQIEQCVYAINGVVYTSEVKKHTLSAPNVDPAIHRIDLIVGGFNTNGEAITYVKEGIEGNIALKPTINPDIEIELGEILVSGNTTQPVDVTNEIFYDEDETVINANGTSTIGTSSTAFLGTKAIESTLADGEKFYIERPASIDTAGFTNSSFAIQAFGSIWQRGANLRLYFEDENNNQISNVMQVYGRSGNPYSFDSSTNLWEVITIPIANFSITGQVKRLVIEKNDGRNAVSFRMDRVILQLGTMPSSPNITVTKTSELENDGAGTGGKYIDEARIAELLGALKFIQNRYADMTALYAGQNNQTDRNIQYVDDASGYSTVDSGYAYFEYLGTTNGDETDYRKLSEEESMDLIVQANDVLFDDSLTALGVTKVQQAIEFLSKRTNGGLMDGTFKWSNNTTIEDPGNGLVRFDTGLVGTVTEIAFDQFSDAGTDVSIHMESLNKGDKFLIFRQNDANKYTKVELTDAPIDEGGWFRVPVTVLESGAELDNNQPIAVIVALNRQTAVEPSAIKLTPNYGLPSSTQDVVIECIGMNEQTSVAFGAGVTINSQKIEKNNFGALILRANVTHDATEQSIDVTIDNGQSKVFNGVYNTINAGTPEVYNDNYLTADDVAEIPSEDNTVYIDAIKGDDSNGLFGKEGFPFQTWSSALASLPIDDGTPMYIITKNDAVIDAVIPNRKLVFMSKDYSRLKFSYIGNIYDNTAGSYNELTIINTFGEVLFDAGQFLCHKTKIIVEADFINQTNGNNISGKLFEGCEEIQYKANSSNLQRAGIANIINTGETSVESIISAGVLDYPPFSSNSIMSSNYPATLILGKCDFSGTQNVTLVNGGADLILNNDVRHNGTGTVSLAGGGGEFNIKFNNINNLRRCRIPVMSSWCKVIMTGFIANWENENVYPIYATNELHTDAVTQSSVECRDLTILNFTSTNTFFYAHSNTQTGTYTRFKVDFVDCNLTMDTRFLSVSNRSKNFEITNCIISDIGDLTNPSIIRGDGLTSDIDIICRKPNRIAEITELSIKFVNILNEQESKFREETASYTVTSIDNKKLIWLNPTSPITITVDDVLTTSFECEFINISANDVTFVAGTGILNSPDGLTLSQNKVCTLLKRLNNNDYWLKGELA